MSKQTNNDNKVVKGENPRKRIKLGTRNILTAPQRPGFVRRFVNDTGDRIQMFKDAGWNTAEDVNQVGDPKLGRPSSIGSSANPHVGGGQRAVLMELPEEIYLADRAESQAAITRVENEMRRDSKTEGKDGLSGKIEIS